MTDWRPISSLSMVYKITSGTTDGRLKGIFNNIILQSQTRFIKRRFISDCMRLMYDIIHASGKNIPGTLMSIDFGYDDNFINWIK